jgi:phosphate transport system substrate-binding protein
MTKAMMRFASCFLFFGCLLCVACTDKSHTNSDGKPANTPTSGEMTMWSDEGLRPILKTSIDVFDSIYEKAKINVEYKQENEIIQALIDDSVEVALITRNLTTEELEYFNKFGFTPRTTQIAFDAMAVILHPQNRDTAFTVSDIKDMLSGKISTWKQRNAGGPAGDIVVVFDNAGAGTVRYAKDSILMGEAMSPKANALKNNEEVIAYVAKNKSAIGLISANWISDTDDTGVQTFLKEVRLAEIGRAKGEEAFTPHQAYLATGQYPFKRGIWYIDATARNFGLGAGFASFLASDRGQRIILKSGLLPATMPLRVIKPTKE